MKRIAAVFSIIAATTLAARGGLQVKPLAPSHAFVLQPNILSNVALNSTFTLLRTQPGSKISVVRDFDDQAMIKALGSKRVSGQRILDGQFPKQNVMILIIESMATEYVGSYEPPGYMPFIDELISKGLSFEKSYANGRRSIDASTSILLGIPSLMDTAFVVSPYAGNYTKGLPQYLKPFGYKSYFFHGARNGSMHFDVLSKIAGFERYYGMNEYPDAKKDYDGSWGIYDEPFLKFAADRLSDESEPFFATFFSLTSHNPFPIPEELKTKFPEGTLPIHQVIGYTDYSLRKFFEYARTKKWFNNTLFIITGDHTSLSEKIEYQNDQGRYRVPLILYHPNEGVQKRIGQGINRKVRAQHVDVLPTVLEFLNLRPQEWNLFGASLFAKMSDPDRPGFGVFNQEYGVWWMHQGGTVVRKVGGGSLEIYGEPLQPHVEDVLSAYRQYSINGALKNEWYIDAEERWQK